MNLPNIKKCKKCGRLIDYQVCPYCRKKKPVDEVDKFIEELELDEVEVEN